MSTNHDLDLEHLLRLPPGGETWQVKVTRLPVWIREEGQPPHRPLLALCRSEETGMIGVCQAGNASEEPAALALRALANLSRRREVRVRPVKVRAADPGLAAALGGPLEPAGTKVEAAREVALVDEALADLTRRMSGPMPALSQFADDVPDETIRVYAEAAVAFFEAAPWNLLIDEDLIQVEVSPPGGAAVHGLEWCAVLGAAGIERGLGFFPSARDHRAVIEGRVTPAKLLGRSRWSFLFDQVDGVPIRDSERWEAASLPLAGGDLLPVLFEFTPEGPGPGASAAVLHHVAALLRAIAGVTEDELDQGRWVRTVRTAGHERTYTLSLPGVLELAGRAAKGARGARGRRADDRGELPDRRLMEREFAGLEQLLHDRQFESVEEINAYLARRQGKPLPRRRPGTPQEAAQEMFYEALELPRGRPRVRKLREAVRTWPDCADALVALAEARPDRDRRQALYAEALAAAERTLGEEPFREDVGHFWGIHTTRPYMRARAGLARCLWERGERDAALAHWREMLRLNPGDNQGIRFEHVSGLIVLGRNAEAEAALAEYEDDRGALLEFARALVAFRLHGPGPQADARLGAAQRANRHVLKRLIDPEWIPDELPESYARGSEEEAILVGDALAAAWQETKGAVEWLRAARRSAKKERESKRRK